MLVLIHGNDPALIEERSAALVRNARQIDPAVAVDHVDGEKASPRDLMEALSTLSLFASVRVVLLRGLAGRAEKDERLFERVTTALLDLPPGLSVIFEEAVELPSGHSFLQAVRAAGGQVLAAGQITSRDFSGRIAAAATALGIAITGNAIQLLSDRCYSEREINGTQRLVPDLIRARTELAKLATFAGAHTEVDERMVEGMVTAKDQQVFAFTDALAARNAARAGSILDHLLSRGEAPQVIFANIIRLFRQLLFYVAGRAERHDVSFLTRGEFHLRDFQMRKLEQQSAAFPLPRLKAILSMLMRADEAIKAGTCSAEEALRLLCMSICTGQDLLVNDLPALADR